MHTRFEGRESDSPYIEAVWRGQAGRDYAPVCPASNRWNLLFLRQNGRVKVTVVGPLTRATPVSQDEGTEWFGVTFQRGTFLPSVSIRNLLDEQATLPLAAQRSFQLAGSSFQFPDYENVETFVERLVRKDLLISDPLVKAVLAGQPPEVSTRTVRRRFLLATGLTYKVIAQIERAHLAAHLLEQGVSLLDTTYQAGYADQSHMTRSLKHFIGSTPAQIAQIKEADIAVHFIQDKILLPGYDGTVESS
ncbi:MAG TPA: helix-turn-helix domain-containing protein [Ktedonobacteraceae bacterium]